ncbi:MAG: hypothetical protein AAFY20_14785 [Cyanobacteria bacterium J06639_14]
MTTELTPRQQFPARSFASTQNVKDWIRTIPGYENANFYIFANEENYNRYAPRGAAIQTVVAAIICPYTLKPVERWFAVIL